MNLKGFASPHGSQKVLLAMSGGRKSAIAASILLKQGYQVIAVHFTKNQTSIFPCSEDQTAKVRELTQKMGIDLHLVDIADPYQINVEERFLHDRIVGLASNPCLYCQGKLCFEPLVELADKMKINWIATGHGAQIITSIESGRLHLYQAADPAVDESELLIDLTQDILKRLILPLGTLNQSMLFKLAVQFDLAEPDDVAKVFVRSGQLCLDEFSKPVIDWIDARTPGEFKRKGVVRTSEQEIVGVHEGLFKYRLGDSARALKVENEVSKGLSVESFDSKTYEVRIGPKKMLDHQQFMLKEMRWILPLDPLKFNTVTIKLQSRKETFQGLLVLFEGARGKLRLDQPLTAVNLGESVAIYDKQELLGGAVIEAYVNE